jgi:UTP--glucose-1-phosphate uridylyltransferase
MKIRKAIIPVAGKGTRFLPATKEIPKEIIPIINVPMIHYVVQEAVEAGIEQIVFVTSSGKYAIEDYFDRNQELEAFLERNNKIKELELIRKIGSMVSVTAVRQKEQLGLGHAVLMAKDLIGDEPFAVLLGDDIVINNANPATKQLMKVSAENDGAAVIGVMEIPKNETHKYGIVKGEVVNNKTLRMTGMVEKPKPEEIVKNYRFELVKVVTTKDTGQVVKLNGGPHFVKNKVKCKTKASPNIGIYQCSTFEG